MSEYSIRELISDILKGCIRIPAFQRGFVWESDRVAHFMDSIYKGFPFGSFLLWRTNNQLQHERQLGPFELPIKDAELPIDYVLDGQQRITSIFSVFQTELLPLATPNWLPIYFDFSANGSPQESQFIALNASEFDKEKHFPISTLFDTVKYRQATKEFNDTTLQQIDEIQSRFKEVKLPIQTVKTEDKTTVAIVFERVNQRGVPLDTLQLLTAWTWSEEFDLQAEFKELAEELEPFGFGDIAEDPDLLLRCCAAVVVGDASPQSLISLNGSDVRDAFEQVKNGIKGSIDFLKSNFNIHSLEILPYPTIIVPLVSFFAVSGNSQLVVDNKQRLRISSWFWKTCFSKRYSSGVLRNLKQDIEEIKKLRTAPDSSRLGAFTFTVPSNFYLANQFRAGSVNTKTFIIQLASKSPHALISGGPVQLDAVLQHFNKKEFHHVYPAKYLKSKKHKDEEINCLANFCFLPRAENNKIAAKAPSEYRKMMPGSVDTILETNLLPENMFLDDYDSFSADRVGLLVEHANLLINGI